MVLGLRYSCLVFGLFVVNHLFPLLHVEQGIGVAAD